VIRVSGEMDDAYGPRIIAQVLRPASNNIAIQDAIRVFTGQVSTVTDVALQGTTGALYDGTHTHNSSIRHDTVSSLVYGLFDVTYSYDLINGSDFVTFQQAVLTLIENLRAAGTHMRSLGLVGSVLIDTLTPPTDGGNLAFALAAKYADAFVAPVDLLSTVAANVQIADSFVPPSDQAFITIHGNYAYNGVRKYDGTITHTGGTSAAVPF
jgi:hypothetical protein